MFIFLSKSKSKNYINNKAVVYQQSAYSQHANV